MDIASVHKVSQDLVCKEMKCHCLVIMLFEFLTRWKTTKLNNLPMGVTNEEYDRPVLQLCNLLEGRI